MWFVCFAHGQQKFCSFNFCEWLNSRKTRKKIPCKNYQPKLPSIHSTDSVVLTTLSMACVGNNSIIKTICKTTNSTLQWTWSYFSGSLQLLGQRPGDEGSLHVAVCAPNTSRLQVPDWSLPSLCRGLPASHSSPCLSLWGSLQLGNACRREGKF